MPLTASQTTPQTSWQQELAKACRQLPELLNYLELDLKQISVNPQVTTKFPLHVTYAYLSRIEKGNPNDPLLRQILPMDDELVFHPGYTTNPVGDLEAGQTPGLLHKFHQLPLLFQA